MHGFRRDHVRQLGRLSRELLARVWAGGGGPDGEPLTIDLDSIRRRRTRPMDWPRKAPSATTTPASEAITIRLHQSRRNLIKALPETDWTPPIPAVSGC